MSKRMSIPTTTFVPAYPEQGSPEQITQWFRTLGGFMEGVQAVKNLNGLNALRIGPLIYIQGEFETDGNPEGNFLPTAPRDSGFLTAFSATGQVFGVRIVAGELTAYPEGLPEGTYYLNGTYIARNSREN